MPVNYVKISSPRKVSDEQKKAVSERFREIDKNMRNTKNEYD